MSIEVKPDDLPGALREYGFAYLITVNAESKAHIAQVTPAFEHGQLRVSGAGRSSAANAAAHPAVTLAWPPLAQDGYTLIVDGYAESGDDSLVITPGRAVLHRRGADGAGQPAEPGTCAQDCVELSPGTNP
jgi:hypothetical protein